MENTCMDFYAFGRIIYANLESLSSFYKTTGNQEHLVEESWMSRIRNFIMWIEELWLLVLVENKKESRKN